MSLASAFEKKAAKVIPLQGVRVEDTVPALPAVAAAAGRKRKRTELKAAKAAAKEAAAVAEGETDAAETSGPGKVARTAAADDAAAARNKLSRAEKAKLRDGPKDTPERLARTVFVGNVPLTATTKALELFIQTAINAKRGIAPPPDAAAASVTSEDKSSKKAKKSGQEESGAGAEATETETEPAVAGSGTRDIQSIRFRNVPINPVAVAPGSNYRQMAKAAFIKGSIDTDHASSMNAYVVLKSLDTVADVLALNGAKFEDHHLRFDRTDKEVKYDPKRTIFVGNLHFDCGEEELRRLFAEHIAGGSASIEGVRIVRDRATHKCKGIAFVLFRERTHVAEALGLREIKLKGREVRISRCSQDGAPLPYASAKGTKKSQSGVAKQTRFMGERGDDKVRAPRPKKSGSKRDSAGGKGKGKPFNKKGKASKHDEGKPAPKAKAAAGDE